MHTSWYATAIPAALVVGALALTGCSCDSKPETVTRADAAAPVVKQEDVDKASMAYVEALASNDLVAMRQAQKAAADGSLAEAYMRHQANGNEAAVDGGYPEEAGEATKGDDTIRACYKPEGDSKTTCYEYGDFKVDDDGELASFTIDGKELAGRLSVGDGTPTQTPLGAFVFDTAYITQSGDLAVSGRIRTKNSPIFIEAMTNYRSPDGRVRAMSSSSGLSELPAQSRSSFTAYFTGPIKFGGEMNLAFVEDGGEYSQATATVKIE
jgi:hypothetical protein